MAGIGLTKAPELLERGARCAIGVVEQRRGRSRGAEADRQQIATGLRLGAAFRTGDGIGAVRIILAKAGIEEVDDMHVETVEPHHRRVRLVAVIVPRP